MLDFTTSFSRPPLICTPEMGKVIKARLGKPGAVMEMKIDNRYKDGNIKIVKGVVRGNKYTIMLTYYTPVKGEE